jgi:hypothetical protein
MRQLSSLISSPLEVLSTTTVKTHIYNGLFMSNGLVQVFSRETGTYIVGHKYSAVENSLFSTI